MRILLSNTEWKLMNHLWEHTPMTIMELTRALADDTGWTKQTIITMLSRLDAKGAVYYKTDARARKYYPAITREDAQLTETESFLDKVYGGRLGLMMSSLIDSHALTEDDIQELSEILQRAGREK